MIEAPLSLIGRKTILPPPRGDTIQRPRVLRRLDEGRQGKLTLLSASAGSGKTTVLCDWLARQTQSVAWVSLSPADCEPMRFWAYIFAALKALDSGLSLDSMPLIAGDPGGPAESLVAAIANAMSEIQGEVILALDNVQFVGDALIHASLGALVEHLPPHFHIVAASRTDPNLPLSRLRSLGHLTEVRGEELRFTLEESTEFLNGIMGLGLSHREVETLHTRVEGWPGGLRLAALALGSSDGDPQRTSAATSNFGGSHPYVLDYFADEVLSGLPEDQVTFLVQTSITDGICAGLGEAITGCRQGQAMLDQLRRANLFLIPLDNQSRWYRYHHCFAEVLARRLEDEAPQNVKSLHERAMQWYLHHRRMRDAAHHALAAGNFNAAADVIELQVDELMWERGEIAKLLRWLDALPPTVLRARPRLSLAHAWALALTGQLQAIEEHLAIAEQSLARRSRSGLVRSQVAQNRSRESLSEDTLGEIAAVRAIAAGLQIDTNRLASLSVEAVAHGPDSTFLRSVLALSRGRAHDIAADIQSAIAAYAEARDLSESIANTHILAVATSRLAELWALKGELRQAADMHRRILHLGAEKSEQRSAVSAMSHVGLGGLLHEWNDLRGATDQFEDGMRLAASWGHLETLKGSYFGLARVRFAQGAGDEALELLSEAESLARHSNAPRSIVWIHAMQARMSLAQGSLAAAVQWAETSPLRPDREPMRLFTGEYTTLIRLLIAQGEHDQAFMLIEGLLRIASAEHWLGLIIELRLLQALAFQARGSIRLALPPLRKAVALAAPEGYMRTFLDEGDALADLLARAHPHGEMPPYLEVLLAALGPRASSNRAVLTQREQEILRYIAAGESNQEIAASLFVALPTVKRHTSNIFNKLGVTSRTQAVARARQLGFL